MTRFARYSEGWHKMTLGWPPWRNPPEQAAAGGGNVQQNWFASAEALRWMLLMLCWSDYEAAVVFDIGWEDLQLLLDGKEPVPRRIWVVYMPCATMLRDQMQDTGHWPFPPRSIDA